MTTDASTLRGNWNYPTKVRFGVGRIAELPAACQELGINRPLIATDPGLAGLPGRARTSPVPPTAGTGSEVGRVSVITNEETHQKKLIFHPKVQPSIVISDPALTVGLPPKITAATGMDALAHCFEAYCTPF